MATLEDHVELQKLSVRFAKIETQLEEKTFRWMELAELM